jgi:hypothetical protein
VRITRRHAPNISYRQPPKSVDLTGRYAYSSFGNDNDNKTEEGVGDKPHKDSLMTRRPLGGYVGKDQLEWMEGIKVHRNSGQGPAPATELEAKAQQEGEPAPPQNLGEEFTAAGRKFSRVSFEKV